MQAIFSQHKAFRRTVLGAIAASAGILTTLSAPASAAESFIPRVVNSSTIPANGDLNPYGVAFVPARFPRGGAITAGDVLVSNFNNSANIQGTGTTIVQLTPGGVIAPPTTATTFFTSKLLGLSTAIGVLRGGLVIVGSVPTADGTFATIGQGALQVIDQHRIDVIISDERMPGMAGSELLAAVRKRSPQTIRMMLSRQV